MSQNSEYDKVLNLAGFSICERYTVFWICQNMPCLTEFQIYLGFWIYQYSEFKTGVQGSKFARTWLIMSELDVNTPEDVWIYDNKQYSEYLTYNT